LRAAEIEDGKEGHQGATMHGASAGVWPEHLLLRFLILFVGLFSLGVASAQAPQPNVILILVDDLGYGDIAAYGATDIQTPNIDRLSSEGIAFSNFHVAPSCSLSRVMFLTGSYAPRTGMSRNFTPSSAVGIHANEVTIAELAKSAGYATGVFGKWHLGDHYQFRPMRHGFDEFFGIPHSNNMWPFHPRTAPTAGEDPRLTTARERAELTGYSGQGSSFPLGQGYPNLPLYDGDSIVELNSDQATFTSGFTDRAIDFIQRHASEPFFIYLPHSAPHVPLHPSSDFVGTSTRDLYGDTVEEIDFHVGRILDKLTELGIDDNTLVIFTSDNGPWLEYGIDGGSAMPYTAGKETQFEGGVRVPGLMRWPGQLGPGSVISEPVSAIDVLPTLAGLFGATLPTDRTIDGVDIWPLLNGDVTSLSRPAIFGFDEAPFSQTDLGAVRAGNWKLMVNTSGSTVTPVALFDLGTDPFESNDVKSSNAGVVDSLRTMGQQIVEDINANRRPLGQVVLSGEPFAQETGFGEIISIEAEHFHTQQARSGHSWDVINVSHNSADEALQAVPDSGANINSNYVGTSPHLQYRINVRTPGRYYVWARARASDDSADSLHVGLNGIAAPNGFRLSNFATYWSWSSTLMTSGERAYVDIGTAGEHVLDVWMREDGIIFDKVILTSSEQFEPEGQGLVESQQGSLGPALEFDAASVDRSADEGDTTALQQTVSLSASDSSSASFSISSSAPSWLTATPPSGTTPANSITISADPSGLTAGTYNGTITATASGYQQDEINVTLTIVGESTGFQQDPSTGLVSIETENFDTNTPQGSHAWSSLLNAGASGGTAMEATPNTNTNTNTGYESNSPQLDYLVNFVQAGTYYVWVRGRGETSSDDSLHVGLNGSGQSSSDRVTGFGSAWGWSSDTMDNSRATIEVTAPGEQVLNVWMREDGTQIDKIMLTPVAVLLPTSFGATGPPESSRGPPQPGLDFSIQSESFTVDEGETTAQTATVSLAASDATGASYSLSSSDPSWLTATPSSGTTPASSITITADPSGLAAGVYSGTITATATGYVTDAVNVTLTVVGESNGFQQDPSTGLLSIEVENFDTNTPQGSHAWSLLPNGGASGGTAMEATPNSGTNNNTGFESNSPRLDYLVNFTQTGTHYIWVRGRGVTGSDDSLHVGLNNSGQSTSDRVTGFGSAWGWSDATMDVARATIEVTELGEQVLNIWMREDGTQLDKIVLTTDLDLVPSGFGPPQSSQGPPQPGLDFSSQSESFTVDEGETTAQTATVSLDTTDSSGASYTLSSSDPSWLTAAPASGTTPASSITITADPSGLAAGVYSGTITATATGYVGDAINVTLDVQGALAFSENFDSSDDSNWTPFEATGDSANWQILGGEYRQTLAASATTTRSDAYLEGTYSVLNTQPSLTDFEFAVEVTPQASGLARLGDDVGIMFRYVDDNNYYRLSINSKFGQTRLERRIGGTFSTIAVTSQGYLPGQVIRVGIRMQGAAMLLYRDYGGPGSVLDGDVYIAGYESSLTSGAVALYTQSEAAFDNVELRSLGVQPHVGLVSPVPFLVDPDDTINAQAVVINASGSVDVDFELDSNPCDASSQPQQQLFVTTCVAPSAGEHVVEAIMRDPGEVDRDTATAVATEGLKAVTFGDSITSGFGDGFFLDNIGDDIEVGGVPVGPRQVAVRGYQTGAHDQLTADTAYTSSNVVFDEGIPGELAADLVGRLPTIIERHPDLNAAWVMIGTNDANQNSPQASGLGCSGAACNNTFKGTLLDLVDDMLALGVNPMLAKMPPIFGQGTTAYADPFSASTRNATALEFNNAIGEVVGERGLLAGPDFYDDFLGGGENRYTLFRDFLHPNSLGYLWMSNAWKQVIAPDGGSVFVLNGICVRRTSSACVNTTPYKQNLRIVGDTYYLDRTYTLTSIPTMLDGGVWLLTENDDKTNSRSDYLEFTVDRDVDVYVAFTPTATSLPTWLQGFEDTAESLGVTAGAPTLRLYREFYASGSFVTLGGNVAAGISGGGNNNYIVIVVPR